MNLCKIVVLGDGGVGKTALCSRFLSDIFFDTYDPTLEEDSYRKQVTVDERRFMLELLDTVGQVDHSVRDEWIRNGDAFLIAYSLTSRLTFKMVKTLHEDVRRVKGNAAPDIPIMIVGNKSDLAPELREVSAEEGAALSHALGVVGFLETSAKNRNNVENAFLDLVTSFVRSFDQAKREEDERILAQERERQARAKRGEKAETSLKNRLSHFILRLKPRF